MINYSNLVFKGGGVKGIAYAGALLKLDEMGILSNIQRVAGTSAGAITATMLAIGYSAPEIEQIVAYQMDFSSFMDKGWLPGNIYQFLETYGWYKGDAFKRWLGACIKEKTGSERTRFKDLKDSDKFRDLYVVSTNLNMQYPEVFSVEENENVAIVDAVRMSMSIPLFFRSVRWKNNVMVDGGMGYNYPDDLFDHSRYVSNPDDLDILAKGEINIEVNKQTLGLWLDTKADIDNLRNRSPRQPIPIKNLKEYSVTLVDYLMEMANSAHLEPYDWRRSILIDSLDVKTTDFKGAKEKAPQLVESGKKGVEDYFAYLKIN